LVRLIVTLPSIFIAGFSPVLAAIVDRFGRMHTRVVYAVGEACLFRGELLFAMMPSPGGLGVELPALVSLSDHILEHHALNLRPCSRCSTRPYLAVQMISKRGFLSLHRPAFTILGFAWL
jgi:hypothetical protein